MTHGRTEKDLVQAEWGRARYDRTATICTCAVVVVQPIRDVDSLEGRRSMSRQQFITE